MGPSCHPGAHVVSHSYTFFLLKQRGPFHRVHHRTTMALPTSSRPRPHQLSSDGEAPLGPLGAHRMPPWLGLELALRVPWLGARGHLHRHSRALQHAHCLLLHPCRRWRNPGAVFALALANREATTSIWIETISLIWRYWTNLHLGGIFLYGFNPIHLALQPNTSKNKSNTFEPFQSSLFKLLTKHMLRSSRLELCMNCKGETRPIEHGMGASTGIRERRR